MAQQGHVETDEQAGGDSEQAQRGLAARLSILQQNQSLPHRARPPPAMPADPLAWMAGGREEEASPPCSPALPSLLLDLSRGVAGAGRGEGQCHAWGSSTLGRAGQSAGRRGSHIMEDGPWILKGPAHAASEGAASRISTTQ